MMDTVNIDGAPRNHEDIKVAIKKGLIMVHTGEGKGKTTAGLGMVLRCLGRGYKVAIVQFIKGKWIPGELKALRAFGEQLEYHAMGDGFTWQTQDLEQDKASARPGRDARISGFHGSPFGRPSRLRDRRRSRRLVAPSGLARVDPAGVRRR